MNQKLIPLIGKGYTEDFFTINLSDDQLMSKPHLEINGAHSAILALELDDEGLIHLGLEPGDYLLFSDHSDSIRDKIILVRSEELVIIRQAKFITPDMSILSTPGDRYPSLTLPSENMRIINVMSGFIKPHEGLRILSNPFVVT